MSPPKYEIDLGDEPLDSDNTQGTQVQVKSAVAKKKGRGFSSAEQHHFEGVASFDVLEADNVGKAQKSVEGWVIFVTGLHEECTEEDLYDKFADFGPIRDLRMPLDHRTGYVKGYALLEFGTYQEAKAAVENMDGQLVMEQEIRCDFAFVRGPASVHMLRREDAVMRDAREVIVDHGSAGRKIIRYDD